MKGHKTDSESGLPYKMEIQRRGISLPGIPKGVPSTPNPVTKQHAGLGGKDLPHPFEKGKEHI